MSDVLAYSVPDAGRVLGIGKTTVRKLINAGELRPFKLGARTLIRADALRALIDRRSGQESSPIVHEHPTLG